MIEHLIDLRALLVEREDCDAGTVQQLRTALSQGSSQYKNLRDATDVLKTKAESAAPAQAKRLHLKIGIASYFLGHTSQAVDHLEKADGSLANFYLGKALLSTGDPEKAQKAFEKAEKLGYTASQVQLQLAGIHRMQERLGEAKKILNKLEDQGSHNAEYHYQMGSIALNEGERLQAIDHFERAVQLDPSHTASLFQLAHANDLAGNDEEAIEYYEQCLKFPPVHVGTLKNLGILYEDHEKYDKASECFRRVLNHTPTDEQAKLFYRDVLSSLTMYYSPEEEQANSRFSQVLEIPVTDFELSVRSRNCLKKMNIRTLGDLTRVTEIQLLSSKNFGETSLIEIKEMLGSKGLRLGQSLEEGSTPEVRFRPQHPMSEQEQALLSKPVTELNLSVRSRKCMNRLGLTTLSEVVNCSADQLLEAKNFGQTSLAEVREKLSQIGLSLRGD